MVCTAKALSIIKVEPCALVFDLSDMIGEHTVERCSLGAALAEVVDSLASTTGTLDDLFGPGCMFGCVVVRIVLSWWWPHGAGYRGFE